MLAAIICSTNGPYIFMYIFLFSLILFCGKPELQLSVSTHIK